MSFYVAWHGMFVSQRAGILYVYVVWRVCVVVHAQALRIYRMACLCHAVADTAPLGGFCLG